jgi:hypothetical protein
MQKRALIAALLLCACDEIEQDDFTSQGGISPDPSAILEGSVLYSGPKPRCLYRPDHSVERVLGRVVLTMFEYANPPPPEGSATSALNLMFVEDLFDVRDCLPEGVSTSDQTITRSVSFRWPRVSLFQTAADYQIRGFYDYDEDMNPLFSVTRLPTAGDVIGAALNDVRDASKGLFKISLPRLEDAKNGLIFGGITVVLGDVVRSERPMFELNADRTLSAAQVFFPALGFTGIDGPASLRQFRAATCGTNTADDCGLSLQPLSANLTPALNADGVQVELADPVASAIYTAPVDIETVVLQSATNSGLDVQTPDGKVDPHPTLGAGLGVPWYAPIVLMQRLPDPAAAAIEAQARIPRVLLVGSPLLKDDLTPVESSYVGKPVPIAIPPVAAVELIPGHAECRVPYFAPGTPALVTDGRLANCAELPTGHYAVNVLAGVAGGTQSGTPASFSGARYSGQSWTVPNELGDPSQVSSLIEGQGLADTFVVQDPTADAQPCASSKLSGICTDGLEIVENTVGTDSVACLRRECCDYVSHLCGLPSCDKVAAASGASIAASPTAITGTAASGAGIPNCVPFELPWQCCRAAP